MKRIALAALAVTSVLFIDSSSASAQGFRPAPIVRAPVIVQPNIRVAPNIVVQPNIVARPVYNPVVINPAPVVPVVPVHLHFRVLYRASPFEYWQLWGVYHSPYAAQRAVDNLQWLGYQTFVTN